MPRNHCATHSGITVRHAPDFAATPIEDPSLIIFGGMDPNNPSLQGPPVPEYHMTAWKKDLLPGYNVFYQRYQTGGKAPTADVAINRSDLPKDDNVALICYSAGVEACIMYAQRRKEKGWGTNYIVLLGGGFNTTADLNGLEAWGMAAWSPKMEALDSKILILNDLQGDSSEWQPPEDEKDKKSNLLYEYYNIDIYHFSYPRDGYDQWRPGLSNIPEQDEEETIVDKSPILRRAILKWLETEIWVLPDHWTPIK